MKKYADVFQGLIGQKCLVVDTDPEQIGVHLHFDSDMAPDEYMNKLVEVGEDYIKLQEINSDDERYYPISLVIALVKKA